MPVSALQKERAAAAVEGAKIRLRPITEKDTPAVVRWRNAPHVTAWLFYQTPITEEDHRNWMASKVAAGDCVQYIIQSREFGDVGTCYFKNISEDGTEAEFGIFIGERIAQGQGLGKEATALLIRHGFKTLGLERVWLTVRPDNVRAVKIYENLGFSKYKDLENVQRDDGHTIQIQHMQMTKADLPPELT